MMVGVASFPSALHTQQMRGRRCRCRAIASGANFCNYCHGRCSTPLRRYVLDFSVGEGYLCQLFHYGLGMCVRGNSGFVDMMNIMPHLRVITVCFFCPVAGAANVRIRMVPGCSHVCFRVHSLLPGQVWGGRGHLRARCFPRRCPIAKASKISSGTNKPPIYARWPMCGKIMSGSAPRRSCAIDTVGSATVRSSCKFHQMFRFIPKSKITTR